MTIDSLSGLVVLSTRPAKQADTMRQAIESRGGTMLSLPLIEIAGLSDAADIQALKERVLELDNYRCLIFVSSNAVSYGAEFINDYWPQFPVGVDVVAVGPTTAEAARQQLGCEVTHSMTGMTSEDILQLAPLKNIADAKVGIVRGQGGRELLAETLRSRGASVDYLQAYTRMPIEYNSGVFCQKLREAGVNILTVSSGESLDRLAQLLADCGESMRQLRLLVPSARVAHRAAELGFAKVHDAQGADPHSFASLLGELSSNQE